MEKLWNVMKEGDLIGCWLDGEESRVYFFDSINDAESFMAVVDKVRMHGRFVFYEDGAPIFNLSPGQAARAFGLDESDLLPECVLAYQGTEGRVVDVRAQPGVSVVYSHGLGNMAPMAIRLFRP